MYENAREMEPDARFLAGNKSNIGEKAVSV